MTRPLIKCVGVWDTVGSYGIPAGLGLGGLARYVTSWTRGFHDNEIGPHIENGFHAMAIDEWRHAFPATAWVTKDSFDRPGVEQVWFAGSHSNIGGGYKNKGLSDLSLIWMIARASSLGLEFDEDFAACSFYRSDRGWLLSRLLPSRRRIPPLNQASRQGLPRMINARVHWSARARLGKHALVDKRKYIKYSPRNLPEKVSYTEPCETERKLVALCRGGQENKNGCVLHRNDKPDGWFAEWRARQRKALRDEWADITRADPK